MYSEYAYTNIAQICLGFLKFQKGFRLPHNYGTDISQYHMTRVVRYSIIVSIHVGIYVSQTVRRLSDRISPAKARYYIDMCIDVSEWIQIKCQKVAKITGRLVLLECQWTFLGRKQVIPNCRTHVTQKIQNVKQVKSY